MQPIYIVSGIDKESTSTTRVFQHSPNLTLVGGLLLSVNEFPLCWIIGGSFRDEMMQHKYHELRVNSVIIIL